ncbi:cullin-1-like [Papaver somniferum]|uniref:cullin-1-like n=1 Tax=Papaver somniferum TaxID=3469 RepID=UPI000E6F804C|nr:cullin-1-like [Papaver somniferum]
MALDQLEEGCAEVQMGITKLINIIEGVPESPMDAKIRMKMYTTVYNMGSPPTYYSEELYKRYQGVFNDYLISKVLPAIQEKRDDVSMLQELVNRWANHKVLVTKISRVFHYLDRNYVVRKSLPSLKDAGFGCFRTIVEMKVHVKHVVISLINQERDGEKTDQTLLKKVLEIFVDLGNDEDTQKWNVRSVSNWILEDYTVKAEECLKKEKDRVSHYLHSSTEEKLLKVVQDVLNPAQTSIAHAPVVHVLMEHGSSNIKFVAVVESLLAAACSEPQTTLDRQLLAIA